MNRRFLIVAVTILTVATFGFPGYASAIKTKVDVCHLSADTATFEPISVTEDSLDIHLAHGDVLVGDGLDENCDPITTLAAVVARGVLRCGVSGFFPGFSLEEPAGVYEGFDADLCRVIAAVVLEDSTAVEFVNLSSGGRWAALRDGDVDVVMRTSTNTLRRDAAVAHGGEGVNFGPTYFYDGAGMLVDTTGPGLAGVSAGSTIDDLPAGTKVCVGEFTTSGEVFIEAAAGKGFVIVVTPDPVGDYLKGDCDVLVSDRSALGTMMYSNAGAPWVILNQTLSKEPLAPVVADGDDEWLGIVTWSVNAIMYADELGITAGNIDARRNESSAVSRVFGVAAPTGAYLGLDADWAYRAVKQVGSYGEIYATNLEPVGLVRAGSLNASYPDGGLIYAPPIK